MPTRKVRQWRQTILHRRRLIGRIVQVKNRIRALLKSQGLRKPHHQGNWWKAANRLWMTGLSNTTARVIHRSSGMQDFSLRIAMPSFFRRRKVVFQWDRRACRFPQAAIRTCSTVRYKLWGAFFLSLLLVHAGTEPLTDLRQVQVPVPGPGERVNPTSAVW